MHENRRQISKHALLFRGYILWACTRGRTSHRTSEGLSLEEHSTQWSHSWSKVLSCNKHRNNTRKLKSSQSISAAHKPMQLVPRLERATSLKIWLNFISISWHADARPYVFIKLLLKSPSLKHFWRMLYLLIVQVGPDLTPISNQSLTAQTTHVRKGTSAVL